ncbi:ANTAR domain-containing protein [Streptomyces sp. ODS28]|uniref:ANTAR domain-containing protein n=1 Tax=Streptomyces sp. ODS28 TaxID=3136688 RepID=UPI0031EB1377
MRLRAVSMRLFARAMRGDRRHPPAAPAPGAAPASPLPGLQRAIVLEQAKGVIAECLDCSVDEAGVLLTEHSRRLNQPPDAFACEILNNRGAELRPHKAP